MEPFNFSGAVATLHHLPPAQGSGDMHQKNQKEEEYPLEGP